jgi:hypothetical protein
MLTVPMSNKSLVCEHWNITPFGLHICTANLVVVDLSMGISLRKTCQIDSLIKMHFLQILITNSLPPVILQNKRILEPSDG